MAVVNSTAARVEAWAELTELLDRQLSPLGLAAIEALRPQRGEHIADIGCGTGQTLLQIGDHVGPTGHVYGVDIEAKLLAVSASRIAGAKHISLLEGDARTTALPTGTLDALFSRFGVMAFADPVATFRHLHSRLRTGGRLAFICWQALEDNELDYLPLQATGLSAKADLVPFSFSDPNHVKATLAAAGFREIALRPNAIAVSSGDMDAMVAVLTKVGALGKILRGSPRLRSSAQARLRIALADHDDGHEVTLNAATWIVTAQV